MAAVLAIGESAVLAGWSAAELWGIAPRKRQVAEVITGGGGTSRPGIYVRRRTGLRMDERTTRDAIPCTTPTRTLLDLAVRSSIRDLERAAETARVHSLCDETEIFETIARHSRTRGAGRLRQVMDIHKAGPTLTRNDFEELVLDLMRRAGLPDPAMNVPMILPDGTRVEVDALWPDQKLILGADGYGAHSGRKAFENDRHRDVQLELLGYTVVRFTWLQLTKRAEATTQVIAELLRRRTQAAA